MVLDSNSHSSASPMADHLQDNIAIYALKNIAPYYAREPLYPPEIHFFLKYKAHFAGKTALDIGVGTGRTSRYLASHCARYVGIDLSREMLALFGPPLANTELVHCDMRHFKARTNDIFDFVLGSNAAFDALNHQDRLAILRDIFEMTAPGAIFAFSTHNLNWHGIGQGPSMTWVKDPVRALRNWFEYRRSLKNHRKMRNQEERYATYAILNDVSHHWLALLYYIGRCEQTNQLEEHGFEVLEVYDRDGNIIPPGADDSGHASLYYVCRRMEQVKRSD